MKLYVLMGGGATFYAPIVVTRSFVKALKLAMDTAQIIDHDGYHDIEIYELSADTVMLAATDKVGVGNATCTAKFVGRIERSRKDRSGVWRPA